jgi:hypothetical protein
MRENLSLKEKIKSYEKIDKDNLSRIKSPGSVEILDAESDEVILVNIQDGRISSHGGRLAVTARRIWLNDQRASKQEPEPSTGIHPACQTTGLVVRIEELDFTTRLKS